MAPIVLKVKGNMQSLLPFGNLDSSDDLSKTWRVCTKVKDSLENGSRLENLSWRLWFAHNVNTTKQTKESMRNFKVPEDFDFKAEKETTIKKEADYKRQLLLQQKKQVTQLMANKLAYPPPPPPPVSIKKEEQQRQFTLHQYTSDQAGDQVIELDDIFKSFGGSNMQAYLDPTEEQQLDNLINEAWPISSTSTSPYIHHSNATSPMNVSFPSTTTTNDQYNNEYSELQGSAVYVSSTEAMPPIPLGTLHNKLLNTLPRETLESAGRLLSTDSNTSTSSSDMMIDLQLQHQYQYHEQHQQQQRSYTNQVYHQSTPNTPFITHSSSHQQQQQPMNPDSSYRFFVPPTTPLQQQQHQQNTAYTFSHHHPPSSMKHSKSLPPSRATSPPLCDISSSSSSSSPISPSISPQKRVSAPINSSPSEGKAPICSNCGTASTPLWRRSANDELLCNACGLYLKLHNAPRPKYLKPQSSRKDQKGEDENIIQPLCSNCGTSTTPLWRRDLDGSSLCNACGLYLKLHHEKRPLSMKTDNIKKRQRCDNSNSAKPTAPADKKKNRAADEPLTTTVTFDSNYTFMDDQHQQQQQQRQEEYSPFGSFGLTLTKQPI